MGLLLCSATTDYCPLDTKGMLGHQASELLNGIETNIPDLQSLLAKYICAVSLKSKQLTHVVAPVHTRFPDSGLAFSIVQSFVFSI